MGKMRLHTCPARGFPCSASASCISVFLICTAVSCIEDTKIDNTKGGQKCERVDGITALRQKNQEKMIRTFAGSRSAYSTKPYWPSAAMRASANWPKHPKTLCQRITNLSPEYIQKDCKCKECLQHVDGNLRRKISDTNSSAQPRVVVPLRDSHRHWVHAYGEI